MHKLSSNSSSSKSYGWLFFGPTSKRVCWGLVNLWPVSVLLISEFCLVWFLSICYGSVRKRLLGLLAVLGASFFYLCLLQYYQLVVFSPYVEMSFKSKYSCKELKFWHDDVTGVCYFQRHYQNVSTYLFMFCYNKCVKFPLFVCMNSTPLLRCAHRILSQLLQGTNNKMWTNAEW